ncbi:MAG: bifunctional (p)ppGpp synthetase/guanosine-3',5'-bis(diphosphate) 3'-pyrophosphohydrolase [Clostridiales bacterium]|nr:bifunctional (p)ppGpp synthetase/guanosine-3',5'-bis(diphosphate) 3'-pyrophosphohydrolase [Clostridiales bacterium]
MIYTDLTKKALKLCFEAHKNQVDKTGMPYVFHPFHLAEQMTDEISTVCALLHDVVEDTEYTFEDIRNMGFPNEVIEVLTLLTHEDGVPYMEYVEKISANPIATRVKLADLRHNSDLSRLDIIDENALARAEKYQKAIELLLNKVVVE